MHGTEDDKASNYCPGKRHSISIKQSEKLHVLEVEYHLDKLKGIVSSFV